MDNKKICFITAVNSDLQYNECLYYISKLFIPEGYKVDTIGITGASSMCSAYNAGMNATDAKYKVYLHQDVLIRNSHFIEEILTIFSDSEIGMIGVAGGTKMPQNGICFAAFDTGYVDEREPGASFYMRPKSNTGGRDVIAIDGLIMVTQYDVNWREDLFEGFHYYDISQSFEFKRSGYRIYVPHQDKPWVIHNCNFANLSDYEGQSQILINEYREFLTAENIGGPSENFDELTTICKQLTEYIGGLIAVGKWDSIYTVIEKYRSIKFNDSILEIVGVISDVCVKEMEIYGRILFMDGIRDLSSALIKYQQVKYGLIRMELHYPLSENEDVINQIIERKLTVDALRILLVKISSERAELLKELMKIYSLYNMSDELHKLKQIEEIIKNTDVTVGWMLVD